MQMNIAMRLLSHSAAEPVQTLEALRRIGACAAMRRA